MSENKDITLDVTITQDRDILSQFSICVELGNNQIVKRTFSVHQKELFKSVGQVVADALEELSLKAFLRVNNLKVYE